MKHEGLNRWYRDGYLARMNGKPLDANPRRPKLIMVWDTNLRRYRYKYEDWSAKAMRWQEGWRAADETIGDQVKWDREQDLIRELLGNEEDDAA